MNLRFTLVIFVILGIILTTFAKKDKHKKKKKGPKLVYPKPGNPTQIRCVITCARASSNSSRIEYKLRCAACMDRIRDTKCHTCAELFRDNDPDWDTYCGECWTAPSPGDSVGLMVQADMKEIEKEIDREIEMEVKVKAEKGGEMGGEMVGEEEAEEKAEEKAEEEADKHDEKESDE